MVAVDTAAEVGLTGHAVEHRPVDSDLVRGGVAEFDEPSLYVDLRRLAVDFVDYLLAHVEHVFRCGDHHGVDLGEARGDADQAGGDPEIGRPGVIELLGEFVGADVIELEHPGRQPLRRRNRCRNRRQSRLHGRQQSVLHGRSRIVLGNRLGDDL